MINARWRWSYDIEDDILNEINGMYPIVHVCSGASSIGDVRVDRFFDLNNLKVDIIGHKNSGYPNIRADMSHIPIKDGRAKATICDPPYVWMQYSKYFKPLINELARITMPGGKVILLFPSILLHPTLEPISFKLRPAGDKAVPIYKILSISIKRNGQLGDYV